MGSKPKTPKPTAAELELQRSQRAELDSLTRNQNEQLKAVQRGRIGRRTLLGSGSELGLPFGLRPSGSPGRAPTGAGTGGRAGAARGGAYGGILGSGGLGPGSVGIPRTPSRASSV